MGLLNSILKIFVGDKSKKDLAGIYPILDEINKNFHSYQELSNDELRNKTHGFKDQLNKNLAEIEDQINELRIEINQTDEIDQKESLYDQVDELILKVREITAETLEKILPEAFAVIKETARRFVENRSIEVTANEFDRMLSSNKTYVKLNGNKAYWSNSWDAAGKPIVWDMIHYDVQLIGGIVLHQGKIAEMQTGEGKTLEIGRASCRERV